jgi:hypothetical protein
MEKKDKSTSDNDGKPVVAKEKQKAVAFVNYELKDADGNRILRSNKGFPIYDNEYTTVEEKALVDLAKSHDGSVIVAAELRIVVAQEKPESIDLSKANILGKDAA